MKKLYLTFAISLLLVASGITAAVAASFSAKDPEEFADKMANKVVNIIESKDSENDKLEKLISLFKKNVDTDWMAKFVMGKYYRQIDDDKKGKYLKLYRDYVIYSYIPRFKEYSGERIAVTGSRDEGKGEHIVKTVLKTDKVNSGSVYVDYRLKKSGNGFKVIDIIGEGVSLITTQRSDFAAPLSKKGTAYFIDVLERKVKKIKEKNS